MSSAPLVSVLVRSHNDAKYAAQTFTALLKQDYPNFELLSCDDDSNDGTAEIIARFPTLRLVPRPSGKYVPGRTLNAMVAASRGEIVVFNNADAEPCSEQYLSLLVSPFADQAVMATYANQLSRPDALQQVCKDHERAFGDGKLAAKWGDFFSLASAAIRREQLLTFPFAEDIQYSEDVEWAKRCRQRGGKIVYVPEAKVMHSHNYSLKQLRRRFYNEGRADAQIFSRRISFMRCLGQIGMETLRDFGYLLRRGAWEELLLAPVRRVVQKFSFYQGARDFLRQRQQQ